MRDKISFLRIIPSWSPFEDSVFCVFPQEKHINGGMCAGTHIKGKHIYVPEPAGHNCDKRLP